MPILAIVTDSFGAGSTPSPMLQAIAVILGRLLGMDVINASFGGRGYVASTGGGTFGSASTVAKAVERTPAAFLFLGGINDDLPGLAAASLAAFAAYAAAVPSAPQVVFGVQPSNATDTIATERATVNDAIRVSALASANVIAFHDMIGLPTATPPAA